MNIEKRNPVLSFALPLETLLFNLFVIFLCSTFAFAQPGPRAADAKAGNPGTQTAAGERDGQRDFDFELGSWKIHLKRRLHPLTGSNTWIDFDGTSVTRKLWDGRAQIEEFETDGLGGHIEGLTLRTYDPQTRQWRLYWANSKDGAVVVPQIGKFKDGQGEFYAQIPSTASRFLSASSGRRRTPASRISSRHSPKMEARPGR